MVVVLIVHTYTVPYIGTHVYSTCTHGEKTLEKKKKKKSLCTLVH